MNNKPFESQQYALAVVRSTARAKVFQAIRSHGVRGMTCEEVEIYLQMRHQTASARIYDLVNDGLVYDTLKVRNTQAGRPARVLRTYSLRQLKSMGLTSVFH